MVSKEGLIDSIRFVTEFHKIQNRVHQTAREKGWWDDCVASDGDVELFQPQGRNFGEAVALMHSELSEALEWKRNGDGPSDHIPEFSGVEEEFADVIIRIMDWAAANHLDVANAVIAKAKFNQGREAKHGGKKF